MKTKNPSIDELKQERDHWKIRAINQGSDISEFCAQIDRSADELQKVAKEIEKIKYDLFSAEVGFRDALSLLRIYEGQNENKKPKPNASRRDCRAGAGS